MKKTIFLTLALASLSLFAAEPTDIERMTCTIKKDLMEVTIRNAGKDLVMVGSLVVKAELIDADGVYQIRGISNANKELFVLSYSGKNHPDNYLKLNGHNKVGLAPNTYTGKSVTCVETKADI